MRDLDSSRNEVFNTEYFKTLAARPAHVKDKYCVGAMDGGPGIPQWNVRAQLFEYYWPQTGKWIDKHRRLLWNHLVKRGPVCQAQEEDKNGTFLIKEGLFYFISNDMWFHNYKKISGDGEKQFWNIQESKLEQDRKMDAEYKKTKYKGTGAKNFWEYCCKEKARKCWENNSCDPNCTRNVQNRIRHLSADVGLYLKWNTDTNGTINIKIVYFANTF